MSLFWLTLYFKLLILLFILPTSLVKVTPVTTILVSVILTIVAVVLLVDFDHPSSFIVSPTAPTLT